jgi:hypothetical protein
MQKIILLFFFNVNTFFEKNQIFLSYNFSENINNYYFFTKFFMCIIT